MEVIYQDEYFFAIDKPAGHFVHPPEQSQYPVPREKILIYTMRKQMNHDVYPAHRLDSGTSGVLIFARSRDAVRQLNALFANREIKKTYHAVVRGWVPAEGSIDIPLEIAGFDHLNESKTLYRRMKTMEVPFPVGKKYPSARYSLVEVNPVTGRWHQIRRHFNRISHHLLGDIQHGDSHHNRFFRDTLTISGLCLRATKVEFVHPWTKQELVIEAPACEKWAKINSVFEEYKASAESV